MDYWRYKCGESRPRLSIERDARAELKLSTCHAERSSEESEAILTAKSKHPYRQHAASVAGF